MIKLSELTHLDLSGAFHKEGMGNFGWLLSLPKLLSVTLHNIQGMDNDWGRIVDVILVLIIPRCGGLLAVALSTEAVTPRGRVSMQ